MTDTSSAAADAALASAAQRLTAPPQQSPWSFDGKIGIGTILGAIGQFVIVIVMIANIRSDVAAHTKDITAIQGDISRLSVTSTQVARMDERLVALTATMEKVANRLETFMDRGRK